ncbi:T9SS type A sorting domain-containing protein [Hymenobacter sp. 5317J-9]|uniref:T9SS type A sorting domain-containing protein n=1 Tax=Hymenobacter sp. 5317J-9 TaxID=2932250 RepID=UPI001FD6F587|nr:T9SS type A sorting domain-containing protein [Hymenobacter sp. 5317J-9]UOQ97549.1 T9SS type A sorting domain-containing protein [Hymenobacter sp. 5317J-9]
MKNHLLAAVLMLGGLGLTGQAQAQTTPVYKYWSLKANAQDSAALRSPSAMTSSNVTMRRFVLSNGTAAAPPKAYSSAYGMAFAPAADGGGWSTSANGTGSTLRRYFYVQCTATAPAGVTLRADSIAMNLAVASSVSGTFLGVVYSKNGFTTPADSTEAAGSARTPAGTQAGTANGTTLFNTWTIGQAFSFANNTSLNRAFRYSVPLNGSTGVTITPGQTLTVRIYVSCSSSSTGRYAVMRDLTLKSQQTLLSARTAVQTNLTAYPNPAQNQLSVPHTAASRDARVSVFSATGAKVAAVAAQPGTTETPVDLSGLAKGLYLVEYADGTQRSSARIVKE